MSRNFNFQKLIHETLKTLTLEVENMKEMTRPISPDNAIGRLSRLEAMNEKSINEASLRNLEMRILLLNQALKRIDDDQYGECLLCEQEILENRLKVLPEATMCINCASKKS
jgi:DnaK suppressor protein